MFWGLLVAVLAGMQMVVSAWVSPVAEIALGVGVGSVVVGSWRLRQASLADAPSGAAWRRRVRRLWLMAGLWVYGAVLFGLWRRAPGSVYLLVNACLFVLVAAGYVIVFAQTVGTLATVLNQPLLIVEARLFNWSNWALLAPLLALIVYVCLMAAWREMLPPAALTLLFGRASATVVLALLLPFSLTLALAWTAKDAVLEQLLDRQSAPEQSA